MSDDWHKDEVASVYIFSYSGFILFENLDIKNGRRINRGGMSFDVQPLARIAPANWRPIPQFDDQSLARLFPGAPQKMSVLAMSVLPSLDANGQPALQAYWSKDQPTDDLPRDTVMVVARGIDHATKGETQAAEIVSEIFLWLRHLTRQWWIGRPSEALTGNLHTVIGLKAGDVINGWPTGRSRQVSPNEGTKRVDEDVWTTAILNVVAGKSPERIDNLKSDANYYFFIREYQTAIIVLCSIFEIMIAEIIRSKNLKKHDLQVGGVDLLGQVTKGFEKAVGRNLQKERPSSYDFVKSCWIARGKVAHGKPLVWFVKGKKLPVTDLSATKFSDEIDHVIEWLRSIK